MKSTGSWGIIASLLRRSYRPICATLIPSMIIEPPVSSTSLNKATPREDFPANAYRKHAALTNADTFKWKRKLKSAGWGTEKVSRTWSSAAHNADGFFRQDSEGQVLKHQRQIIAITHLNILKGDLSVLRPGGGRLGCLRTLSRCFALKSLR